MKTVKYIRACGNWAVREASLELGVYKGLTFLSLGIKNTIRFNQIHDFRKSVGIFSLCVNNWDLSSSLTKELGDAAVVD